MKLKKRIQYGPPISKVWTEWQKISMQEARIKSLENEVSALRRANRVMLRQQCYDQDDVWTMLEEILRRIETGETKGLHYYLNAMKYSQTPFTRVKFRDLWNIIGHK